MRYAARNAATPIVMVAFATEMRLRQIEIAVETRAGLELWIAQVPVALLRVGGTLELDRGSYEIVGFGSSGIVGAEKRVRCRPAHPAGAPGRV